VGVKVHAFIGGANIRTDQTMLKQGVQVIVGTPGRVCDLLNRKCIDPSKIKCFVLDEADEMLSQGFKDQIYEIFQFLPESVQVALFSATMPPEALELTEKFMNNPFRILVKKELITLEGIRQFYIDCEHENWKLDTLCDLYDTLNIAQSVIFCNSRNKVTWLAEQLRAKDFTVSATHSQLDQATREAILSEFKLGTSRVLISTDLIGRGIDVHGISLVVNFDIPKNFEKYIHRIGRAGRLGRKGVAINLVSRDEIRALKEIERFYQTKIVEMPANIADFL